MNKEFDRLARKPPAGHSASASVSKTKRPRSRTGSTGDRLVSSTADRQGHITQDLTGLALNLGRIAAQTFRHMRVERFRSALTNSQQLVRKHPLQTVLVGVGLGYLLSRTKVR